MIENIQLALSATLVYLIFWASNVIASLILNLAVIGENWNKDRFIKSIWRLLGLITVVVLLAIGLSLASTDTITIATLTDLIYAAAFTRLAEAITKVKDMFGYKYDDEEVKEDIIIDTDTDEWHEN